MNATSNQAFRILLVDDDPADRELTCLALDKQYGDNFDVVSVSNLTAAIDRLQVDSFDAILLDLGLPDSCGVETIERLRGVGVQTPIVVLTDLDEGQVALHSLECGAQDYLCKNDLSTDSLGRALRYAIQRYQLLTELADANAKLARRNGELAKLVDTAQRFVDNVSHEFRTPLTVIKEYVSLLREGLVGTVKLDDEQCRFLDVLADRADDLNTMVDDMLDVSKLEAGLLGAWRRKCRLQQIVKERRGELQSKAAIKRVQLDYEIDDGLPEVYCDPEKLGRVITNLVVNAIKFCREPGQIRVSARANPTRKELVIDVRDNGPGIGTEDVARVFARFGQLDTDISGTNKGFGLGLSVAKELVDVNLGEMSVESQMGTGTTFSFTVPLNQPIEIVRRYLDRIAATEIVAPEIALVEVTPKDYTVSRTLDDVDSFLNYMLRKDDLLFRTGEGRWILVLPADPQELVGHLVSIEGGVEAANRNRSGEPLPELHLRTLGQWLAAGAKDGVLHCFQDALAPERACHV